MQPLDIHLSEVGQLASEAAAKLNLKNAGLLIGLLHDLGKYSSEFQEYIRSETGLIHQDSDESGISASRRGKIDHSTAGAQWTWKLMSESGVLVKDNFVVRCWHFASRLITVD